MVHGSGQVECRFLGLHWEWRGEVVVAVVRSEVTIKLEVDSRVGSTLGVIESRGGWIIKLYFVRRSSSTAVSSLEGRIDSESTIN